MSKPPVLMHPGAIPAKAAASSTSDRGERRAMMLGL
jgi:hypothetical protein